MGKDSVGNIPFVEYNRHRQKKNSYKEETIFSGKRNNRKNIERLIHYIAQQKKVPEKLSLSCRFDCQ